MTVPDTRTPFDEAGEAFVMLSRRAWATNLERAERLVAGAEEARARPTAEREPSLRVVSELAHQIAGSAGTFGFDEVSELARKVESWLGVTPVDADQLVGSAEDVRAALLLRQPEPA